MFEQISPSQFFQPLIHREYKRVKRHVERARARGLPATLTLRQWLAILHHYRWTCAICDRAGAETIEHIIPVALGGGTTSANCVPCCKRCNQKRADFAQQTLRVQSELTQLDLR